jgi:predicted RNase H-like HicB family nuclease
MKERVVAKIRRDRDGNWLVTFPQIRGAHTYGRSLAQVRRRIPEVLTLWDRDPSDIELVEVLELPANVKKAIKTTTESRRDLEVRARKVQQELEKTIKQLETQMHLSVRDSGELLRISPQYAHKLRRAGGRLLKARS